MKHILSLILLATIGIAQADVYTYSYSASVVDGQNEQLEGATFTWSANFNDAAGPIEHEASADIFLGSSAASLTISDAATSDFNGVYSSTYTAMLREETSTSSDSMSSQNTFTANDTTFTGMSIEFATGYLDVSDPANTISAIDSSAIVSSSIMVDGDQLMLENFSATKTMIPEPSTVAFFGVFGGAIVFLRRLMM